MCRFQCLSVNLINPSIFLHHLCPTHQSYICLPVYLSRSRCLSTCNMSLLSTKLSQHRSCHLLLAICVNLSLHVSIPISLSPVSLSVCLYIFPVTVCYLCVCLSVVHLSLYTSFCFLSAPHSSQSPLQHHGNTLFSRGFG